VRCAGGFVRKSVESASAQFWRMSVRS
jgi:hypothetical protein